MLSTNCGKSSNFNRMCWNQPNRNVRRKPVPYLTTDRHSQDNSKTSGAQVAARCLGIHLMIWMRRTQCLLLLMVWSLPDLIAVVTAQTLAEPTTKDTLPGSEKPASVGAADVLEFRQSKVTAETTELEERIFRLSEAMKQLEPENSSRLLLALKFAREELIRHQMESTEQLLKSGKLPEAASEEKQIISKLQRLHDLLLSADLDFQMRLEACANCATCCDAWTKSSKRRAASASNLNKQQRSRSMPKDCSSDKHPWQN